MTLYCVKAEYVVAIATACQSIRMRKKNSELQHEQDEPTYIFGDNLSAIAILKNHFFHKKSKHIDTRYHYI